FMSFFRKKDEKASQGENYRAKNFVFPKTGDYAGLQANRTRFFTENQIFSQTPKFSQCDFAIRMQIAIRTTRTIKTFINTLKTTR
ncbi:MAG: hypothetical protein RRY33_04900, partial [Alistipes sp.]